MREFTTDFDSHRLFDTAEWYTFAKMGHLWSSWLRLAHGVEKLQLPLERMLQALCTDATHGKGARQLLERVKTFTLAKKIWQGLKADTRRQNTLKAQQQETLWAQKIDLTAGRPRSEDNPRKWGRSPTRRPTATP